MALKKEKKIEIPEGLNQTFKDRNGKKKVLKDFLNEGDWWETKGRNKMTMLKHDAVKKLAEIAGYRVIKYDILTQPTVYNNMECVMSIEMVDSKGNVLEPEIGEANRNNLGSMGKRNPMNMAQKRAYDRTVLFNLGIKGILSDEEIPQDDENGEKTMENLTHDEKKTIAPLINQLLLAKTKANIAYFDTMMKNGEAKKYNEQQLDYLRKFRFKRLQEISANPF